MNKWFKVALLVVLNILIMCVILQHQRSRSTSHYSETLPPMHTKPLQKPKMLTNNTPKTNTNVGKPTDLRSESIIENIEKKNLSLLSNRIIDNMNIQNATTKQSTEKCTKRIPDILIIGELYYASTTWQIMIYHSRFHEISMKNHIRDSFTHSYLSF